MTVIASSVMRSTISAAGRSGLVLVVVELATV
jgi:hypothetical protein